MATGTQLPPIETKFSFTGLQDAAAQLGKIQAKTDSVFSQIKQNADSNLDSVRKSIEKLGSGAENPFKKLSAGSNKAAADTKKASVATDGFFKKLIAPKPLSAGFAAVGRDLGRIGSAARLAFAPIQLGASAAAKSVGLLRDSLGATVRGAVGLGKITVGAGLSGAGTVLKAGGLAAGIGPAALAGGLGAASKSTADFITQQQKLARASGTSLAMFQALSSAARRFGAEDDDLKGGLSQLTDKLKDAAKGGDSAQFFNLLGIPTTDQYGRLRDSGKVLLDLIDRTKGLSASQRTGIFNELLGGDAQKLSLLLASDRPTIAGIADQQDRAGVSITPQQVALSNAYNAAIFQLREALRGLSLDIGTRFLPVFTDSANKLSAFIIKNRVKIGAWIATQYNRLVGIANDIIHIFRGQDDYVQNRWLLSVRDRLVVVKGWLIDAGRSIVEFGKEIVFAATGQDERVTQFPWLVSLRDAMISTYAYLTAWSKVAWDYIKSAAESTWNAISDLYNLIVNGDKQGSGTSPIIARFADDVLFVRSLVIALWQTISGQDIGDERFKFLGDIRTDLAGFWQDAVVVFDWFKGIFTAFEGWLQPVLKFFGTDLTQVVLATSLIRLIAQFSLLGTSIKLAASLLTGTAGLAATAVGEGGLLASLSTFAASITAIGVALAPVVAAIGVAAVGLLAAKKAADVGFDLGFDSQKPGIDAAAKNFKDQGDAWMTTHGKKGSQLTDQRSSNQPLGEDLQVSSISRHDSTFDDQVASDQTTTEGGARMALAANGKYLRGTSLAPQQSPYPPELQQQLAQITQMAQQNTGMSNADFARLTPSPQLIQSLAPTPQQVTDVVQLDLTLPNGRTYPLRGDRDSINKIIQDVEALKRRQLTGNPAWGQ